MNIDLHTHSNYSDGLLSPKEVARKAVNAGCNFFSLTDHDTLDGLEEAKKYSESFNLTFVNGVEISAQHSSRSIHIVGLGINPNEKLLIDGLKKNNQFRVDRAKKISEELGRVGILRAYEKARALSKTDYITRTHFAQMLIKENICSNMSSVFKRYMTGKKPGAVKGEWASSAEVINWIHQAGGLAILAHPLRYKMTLTKLKRLVKDLKLLRLDGIEIVNSFSSIEDIRVSKMIADENEILYSGGSDFHGWAGQTIELGNIPKFNYGDKLVINYLK